MPRLTDEELSKIISAEESQALDYHNGLREKRDNLMSAYHCLGYSQDDELRKQSRSTVVSSDVADVVEWMLPSLVRMFTQGKLVAHFDSDRSEYDDEAEQKTHLANYVFTKQHSATRILHDMFKDALLQYTGVVKVFWDDVEHVTETEYIGLSEQEFAALSQKEDIDLLEVEQFVDEAGQVYFDVVKAKKTSKGKVACENIPPNEFVISVNARDFTDPTFIGHRSPKRRSELLQMGFNKKLVDSLSSENLDHLDRSASDFDFYRNGRIDDNPSSHGPNDLIYLGEYYIRVDVDGDGITELWRVFFAGDRILDKEKVDQHPFCVCIPVPMPHSAIGSCPAEQVAPLQYRKSVLIRQMLDNIYNTNYPRLIHSNAVDLDDLLTPRPGGAVSVDSSVADVAGHVHPIVLPTMIEPIMAAIEYTDAEREIRTGMTRYSQGLDGDSLNKTATGFKGIMDASQQRLGLIARLFADTGVKRIFERIVYLLAKHQDSAMHIKVLGEPQEIDPSSWQDGSGCTINVGLGSGDRQEKIFNLNNILQVQERLSLSQSVLVDQKKMYNTLEKLIDEVGLKDANEYFNNPEIPVEVLQAHNEQLTKMLAQMQQMINQNPLAEAELIKAKARMAEVQGKESNAMKQFVLEMAQKDDHFRAELAKSLTELELKYNHDVPGSSV